MTTAQAIFTISVIFCSLVTAVHLDRRFMEREIIGDITKCFLIPTLYFTLFTASKAFPRTIQRPWLLLLIAVFYTLGDYMLLEKEPFSRFVVGALSFSVGHMCYVVYFSHFGLNVYTLIGGMVVFGIPYFGVFRYVLEKKPKHSYGVLAYALTLYLFAVGMSAVFSFQYLKTSILVLIGVILFIFSDSTIALRTITGEKKHISFFIMLTYVLANLFLVLGVWCINVPVSS